MNALSKLVAAFMPEAKRQVVAENDAVRVQVAKLRDEANETIRLIDLHTGIWHQDMLEGVYQGEHRARNHDRA